MVRVLSQDTAVIGGHLCVWVDLFFSPCSVRRGMGWVEEASVKPSELSFSPEAVDHALVGSFPEM